MASLVQRERRGRREWWVKWRDVDRWRWASCSKYGAANRSLRRVMLEEFEALETAAALDRRRTPAEDLARRRTLLGDLVETYLEEVRRRVDTRAARGRRDGLSPRTLEEYERCLRSFVAFAGEDLETGALDGEIIRRWKVDLAGGLAARTVNKHLEALRACIYRYADTGVWRGSPRDLYGRALAALPLDRRLPEVLDVGEIRGVLEAIVARDRTGDGRQAGPLLPLAAVVALSGVRAHEALGLRWGDVDLETGALVVRSRKTGRERRVPLVGDATGDVSPGLAGYLERLRPRRVDPDGLVVGAWDGWPKKSWNNVLRASGVRRATPQRWRSTWVSYLVSMGRPPALVAWWAGHSPTVLERHYADYVRGRLAGETLDEAMGVGDLLEEAAGRG